jgi:hypothetical protein
MTKPDRARIKYGVGVMRYLRPRTAAKPRVKK